MFTNQQSSSSQLHTLPHCRSKFYSYFYRQEYLVGASVEERGLDFFSIYYSQMARNEPKIIGEDIIILYNHVSKFHTFEQLNLTTNWYRTKVVSLAIDNKVSESTGHPHKLRKRYSGTSPFRHLYLGDTFLCPYSGTSIQGKSYFTHRLQSLYYIFGLTGNK